MGNASLKLQSRINDWLAQRYVEKSSKVSHQSAVLGTTIGKRREENQDQALFAYIHPHIKRGKGILLAILCDGMGGHLYGREAATLAVSSFVGAFASSGLEGAIAERMRIATRFANNEVYLRYKGKSGATLSACAFTEDCTYSLVNVGDSRIFSYSNSGLDQLTIDDTILAQLQENGRTDVDPNNPHLRGLLQYIGMGDDLELRPVESSCFESDGILLASDGAYSVGEAATEKIFKYASTPIDAVKKVLLMSEWFGGHDNATTVYVSKSICSASFWGNEPRIKEIDIWTPQYEYTLSYNLERKKQIASPTSKSRKEIQPPLSSTIEENGKSKKSRLTKKRDEQCDIEFEVVSASGVNDAS